MPYIPASDAQAREMLEAIGASSLDELFEHIPVELRRAKFNIPAGMDEMHLQRELRALAAANRNLCQVKSYLGAGCYEHFIPAAVWALAGRSEFVTAYTPYQPEASQGTLTALFEFQTMFCELTGMDASNASLYDGATACAEAALMCRSYTERQRVLVSRGVHPEYRQVLKTYLGDAVEEVGLVDGAVDMADLKGKLAAGGGQGGEAACLIVGYPNFFGILEPMEQVAHLVHEAGAQVVVCANPVALGIFQPPSEFGADVVCGEGQPFGCPTGAGGAGFGFIACRDSLKRKLPGRVVGATKDASGRRGFVLTMQAREQHIRRERATSNICTNQTLNALAATIYLSLLGPEGLAELAGLNYHLAHKLQQRIAKKYPLMFGGKFFNEFYVKCDSAAAARRCKKAGIIPGLPVRRFYPEMPDGLLVCVTEMKSDEDLEKYAKAIGCR